MLLEAGNRRRRGRGRQTLNTFSVARPPGTLKTPGFKMTKGECCTKIWNCNIVTVSVKIRNFRSSTKQKTKKETLEYKSIHVKAKVVHFPLCLSRPWGRHSWGQRNHGQNQRKGETVCGEGKMNALSECVFRYGDSSMQKFEWLDLAPIVQRVDNTMYPMDKSLTTG